MFVINRMTKNPMTVTADTKVDEVAHLMKKHNFRRLPVVDDGKLVGFLSDSDLMRVAPSSATTLSTSWLEWISWFWPQTHTYLHNSLTERVLSGS